MTIEELRARAIITGGSQELLNANNLKVSEAIVSLALQHIPAGQFLEILARTITPNGTAYTPYRLDSLEKGAKVNGQLLDPGTEEFLQGIYIKVSKE